MARARPPYDPRDDVDDDAPWLAEGVREARASTLVPRGRLVGGVLIFVAMLVLVGLGIYVISARKSDGSGGFAKAEDAPLITADLGPYKVAPADPGGAAVTGPSETLSAASSGDDPGGTLDPAMTEEPLARPGTGGPLPRQGAEEPTELIPPPRDPAPAPTAAPAPTPAPVTITPAPIVAPVAKPVEAKPVPKPVIALPKTETPRTKAEPPKPEQAKVKSEPVGPEPARPEPAKAEPTRDVAKPKPSGGAALQLGAFSTAAKADAAWTALTARAPYLSGLAKRVEPLARGDATLYRLRASGVASKAAAVELCVKVKAGGDPCLVTE